MIKKYLFTYIIIILVSSNVLAQKEPVKVGIVGLTHTHVHWILGRENRSDIQIVGIVEPNRDLAERYSEQHGYSKLQKTKKFIPDWAPFSIIFTLLPAFLLIQCKKSCRFHRKEQRFKIYPETFGMK